MNGEFETKYVTSLRHNQSILGLYEWKTDRLFTAPAPADHLLREDQPGEAEPGDNLLVLLLQVLWRRSDFYFSLLNTKSESS